MWCLAITYEKPGRHADAKAELTKLQAAFGDNSAYQCATIYAVWGNTSKALEWLDRAVRLPDAGVVYVKTDALTDSLRKEPRFHAIERALKFPGVNTVTRSPAYCRTAVIGACAVAKITGCR
jgi:hypothetical protein